MRGKNNGFSLLEVMMALAILSIGVLGLATSFGTGHEILKIAREETLAAQLAQNKMESLRMSRPELIMEEEEIQGMTRKWSIAPSMNDPRLWVMTVEVFPPKSPNRAVLLKSLIFY